MSHECPICGLFEHVQRASTIVVNPVHLVSGLARKLAAPPKPSPPPKPGFLSVLVATLDTRDLIEARSQIDDMHQRDKEYHAETELQRWERATERWYSVYYCHTCNVIYIPGELPRFSSPEDIKGLCYCNI